MDTREDREADDDDEEDWDDDDDDEDTCSSGGFDWSTLQEQAAAAIAAAAADPGDDWARRFREGGIADEMERTLKMLSGGDAGGTGAWDQFAREELALARAAEASPLPVAPVPNVDLEARRRELPVLMAAAMRKRDHTTFATLLDESQVLGVVETETILRESVYGGPQPRRRPVRDETLKPAQRRRRLRHADTDAGKQCRRCQAPALLGRRLCARHKNARSEEQRQTTKAPRFCQAAQCDRQRRARSLWCAVHTKLLAPLKRPHDRAKAKLIALHEMTAVARRDPALSSSVHSEVSE